MIAHAWVMSSKIRTFVLWLLSRGMAVSCGGAAGAKTNAHAGPLGAWMDALGRADARNARGVHFRVGALCEAAHGGVGSTA